MNQHAKPSVAFTLLTGAVAGALALSAPAFAAVGTAAAVPAPGQVQTPDKARTNASAAALLAYAPEADQEAYQAKVKALKAEQASEWAELQREHKLARSNPMLSQDDLAVLRIQQADENKAAKETYAGQLEVLKQKYEDGDIRDA